MEENLWTETCWQPGDLLQLKKNLLYSCKYIIPRAVKDSLSLTHLIIKSKIKYTISTFINRMNIESVHEHMNTVIIYYYFIFIFLDNTKFD